MLEGEFFKIMKISGKEIRRCSISRHFSATHSLARKFEKWREKRYQFLCQALQALGAKFGADTNKDKDKPKTKKRLHARP